jgi:hypothetical protein
MESGGDGMRVSELRVVSMDVLALRGSEAVRATGIRVRGVSVLIAGCASLWASSVENLTSPGVDALNGG